MSARLVAAANVRLVIASPSAMRAIAAGSTRPLRGCSPMEVAAPVSPVCAWAMTATSATGSCRGPQHCCCATRPASPRFTQVKELRHHKSKDAKCIAHSQAMASLQLCKCGERSPVTHLSTLVVRKRFEPTAGSRSTCTIQCPFLPTPGTRILHQYGCCGRIHI